MKLFKLLPLVVVVVSFTGASAFAEVGKNGSDVEHICTKVLAKLDPAVIKHLSSTGNNVVSTPVTGQDQPANGATAQ